MELRPYQNEAVRAVEDEWGQGRTKTLLVLPTGCHAIGEKLLLSSGEIRTAENINISDELMGPDGTPRTVLYKKEGTGKLYKIAPIKGEPFIVTEDHKLTLKRTNEAVNGKYPCQRHGGELVDVTVKEWLQWSNNKKHLHKIVRSEAIEKFSYDGLRPISPYYLGLLLGDGGLNGASVNITTMEPEVVEEINNQCKIYDLTYRVVPAGKANTYIFRSREEYKRNEFIHALKILHLRGCVSGSKHVPYSYKTAPIKSRLDVIAGLIDSDGSLAGCGYDFISKSEQLATDLAFMCRSVGLAAYVKPCIKSCNDFSGQYFRVTISGDCSIIPNRVMRKKAPKRNQKKNVLVTGFSVEYYGTGKYVGFTVDGDNRYLLDDFTITHNCGKTIAFAQITADMVNGGKRVLIMAHRGELLDQAADKLQKTTGLRAALEKAENTSLGTWYRVTVGSVQTMTREKRLKKFRPDYFDVIIIDEAHHAISGSYQNVLQYFDGARVLGVTATPDRSDMRDLGEYFQSIAYEYSLPQAIRDGYLVPIKAQTIPLKLDISGVSMSAGDFKASEIGTALDPYLGQIANEMRTYCAGRKTVVFLPLVATSQKFCELLNDAGFRAAEVNGESDDRQQVLKDFDQGKYDVLCNSMLLTEGWDCPSVDCVICLRPTKSRGLYSQMIGRGTRLNPGKTELLLLDFLWLTERHELCRPACLLAKSDEIAAAMTKRIEESPVPMDLEETEHMASEDVIAQREEELAEQLALMKKRKRKLVDPLQFELSIQAEDLAGYVPTFGSELEPVTDNQKKALEKAGIFPDEIDSSGKATQILDRLEKRRHENLTTPKQIRCLEGRGFQHVGQWSFDAARAMIDRIAAMGWRGTPHGVNPKTYVPPKETAKNNGGWWN